MNELFGISMTTIATIMVALLAMCLLVIFYIFLRRPIVFRIGMRNIPRRPAQTVLIIIGLMLSTLIVTAALGVGDTLDKSVRDTAYDQLGQIDQVIISSSTPPPINTRAGYFTNPSPIRSTRVSPVSGCRWLMSSIQSQASAISEVTGRANSQIALTGFDPATIDDFGGFALGRRWHNRCRIVPSGTVVVSKDLAKDLNRQGR